MAAKRLKQSDNNPLQRQKRQSITLSENPSPKLVLALGTLLPLLIILSAFWKVGILPFGPKDILEIDGVHQYLPFLTELRRHLVNGESLFYSFSGGLGYDFWCTIAYYAASPFNLLLVLVPEPQVCDFMTWMMPIKLSIGGGILARFLYKKEGGGARYAVTMGAMYALSNFYLGYKFNVMWLDSAAVTPLILWGLDRLVRERRSGLYIFALFYGIWCNYYIGYMICLFLCLRFLYLCFEYRPDLRQAIPRFALSSLAAGGMAAVLILPAYKSLQMTTSAGAGQSVKTEFYTNLFGILRSHFTDSAAFRTSYDRGDVQIYCGVIVLLLIGLFFVNHTIPLRRRIGLGVLLGFLWFSFAFAPFNFIWHGLHLEVGLPNRFAFLYLIVLFELCHAALTHLGALSRRTLLITLAVGFAVAVIAEIATKVEDGKPVPTFVLLAVYVVILTLLHKRRALALLLCAVMVLECAVHCWQDVIVDQGDEKSFYVGYQADAQALLAQYDDGGFSRMDVDSDSMINFTTYIGGHGVALFHSGMQAGLQSFFESMHAYVRLNTVWYKGVSKPLMDILGQKYLFTAHVDAEEYNGLTLLGERNGRKLYRNPDALSVGYLVNEDIVNWNPDDLTGMDAENTFFSLATGCDDLFVQQMYFFGRSGVAYQLDIPENGMTFALLDGSPQKVEWKTPEFERTYEKRTHMIFQAASKQPDGHVTLTVTTEDGAQYTGYSYTCDGEDYHAALSKLAACQLQNVQAAGNRLTGTIDADRDGILLLTVPYHEGWSVRVDDSKAQPLEIGGVFIGLLLTEGSHSVEMTYTPTGFRTGLAISGVSVLLAAAVLLWERRGRKGTVSKQA